jgi:hypothetical protein
LGRLIASAELNWICQLRPLLGEFRKTADVADMPASEINSRKNYQWLTMMKGSEASKALKTAEELEACFLVFSSKRK